MPLDGSASNPKPLTPFMQPGQSSRLLFTVGERPLAWCGSMGGITKFGSHKALVRAGTVGDPTHKVLSVVNSTYKLVENIELLSTIERTLIEVVPADKLLGVQIKDHASYDGRVCHREYVFPNITCDVGAKSDVGFRIVVANAYGGGAVRVLAGAIEFFCTNGMVTGSYESAYAKHSSGLRIARFDDHIVKCLKRFHKDAETWQRWTRTPVKHAAAMDLFRNLALSDSLTTKLTERYLEEVETRGENLWSVYSAMTYYSAHDEGAFAMRPSTRTTAAGATMFKRETEVQKWTQSVGFHVLEDVTT